MRSFSYTHQAVFSEEFQSVTFLMVGVLVRSFSYTPRAGFSKEFLLHS